MAKQPQRTQTEYRVLVADDHPIVRQGLRQILAATEDMIVAAEASTGSEVLNLVHSSTFDVVVLDLSMPGSNGLEVLQQLKRDRPELPVLVLSLHPEDQYASRVMKLGASGYIVKGALPATLIEALRTVLAGHMYVSANFAEQLAVNIAHPKDTLPHETLSTREYEVMILLASGRTPTEIAAELCLSIKTVSTYRSRLLEKLGVKSSADVIRYAMRAKLVE